MRENKMNPEVKAKWLEALRSGEYKQGKERLQAGDRFCCLGVLCHLAVEAGVIQEPYWEVEEGRGPVASYHQETAVLPKPVSEWAGLYVTLYDGNTVPDSNPRADEDPVAALNDRGAPFDYIADAIEKAL